MPELSTIVGPIAAIFGVLTTWIVIRLAERDRLSKVEAAAADALQTAAEAKEEIKQAIASAHESVKEAVAAAQQDAKEANERITNLASAFALYRESVIEKFVMHDTLREVESRLIESQKQNDKRLTDAINGLNSRFDTAIDGRHKTRRAR
jgi:hypothetical protein